MAFSNNLRGLRSVAMAVLVSGSFCANEVAIPETTSKTNVPDKARAVAGKKTAAANSFRS